MVECYHNPRSMLQTGREEKPTRDGGMCHLVVPITITTNATFTQQMWCFLYNLLKPRIIVRTLNHFIRVNSTLLNILLPFSLTVVATSPTTTCHQWPQPATGRLLAKVLGDPVAELIDVWTPAAINGEIYFFPLIQWGNYFRWWKKSVLFYEGEVSSSLI